MRAEGVLSPVDIMYVPNVFPVPHTPLEARSAIKDVLSGPYAAQRLEFHSGPLPDLTAQLSAPPNVESSDSKDGDDLWSSALAMSRD